MHVAFQLRQTKRAYRKQWMNLNLHTLQYPPPYRRLDHLQAVKKHTATFGEFEQDVGDTCESVTTMPN